MRIAYIIIVHKNFEQVLRLINRLNTHGTTFIVHIDKRADNKAYNYVFSHFKNFTNVYFLKREKVFLGHFSLVSVVLKGIEELFRKDIAFDYAILLSGQDYPIRSNKDIDKVLTKNKGKFFIEYFELPKASWGQGGLNRIEKWHYLIPPVCRFTYLIDQVLPKILTLLFGNRKFPEGFKPYGGSSWWILPRECLKYITEFVAYNSRFVNFFKYVKHPDEIFFQTIILNSLFKNSVVNDNLRYIDWAGSTTAHPRVLIKDDFEKIVFSGKLFARKFDINVDYEILDLLDKHIKK